jgi:methanogenic corrinoid protein MtbC1
MKTIKEDIDKLTKLIQSTDEHEIGKNIITEMIKYESERTQRKLDNIGKGEKNETDE